MKYKCILLDKCVTNQLQNTYYPQFDNNYSNGLGCSKVYINAIPTKIIFMKTSPFLKKIDKKLLILKWTRETSAAIS